VCGESRAHRCEDQVTPVEIAPPADTNPAAPPEMIAPVTITETDWSIEPLYRFTNLKYIRSPNRNTNTLPARFQMAS